VSHTSPTRALIRFHWNAGARVSLRANAVVGAAVVFLFGSAAPAPNALETLRATILGLVSAGHAWTSRLELAAVCAALVAVAIPRVTLGVNGWMRSLAATGEMNRRAATVALAAAQAFAIVVAIGACVATPFVYHAPLSLSKILTLPLIVVSVAMVLLPVDHAVGRAIAAVALVLAIPGTWLFGALSVVALGLADRTAGAIVPLRRRGRSLAKRHDARIFRERPTLVHWISISWSALPTSSVIGAALLPAVFVLFGYLIVRHNPHLPAPSVFRAIRISGSLAAATFAATLAQLMLRVRPTWAWARSLPWSSTNRVSADAVALGLPLCLIPIVLAPLAPMHALAVAATLPTIAAAGASALRGGAGRHTGAAGETFVIALGVGLAIAISAFAAIAMLCLVPMLVRLGAKRERRSRVTRWLELQHDAVGDPAWSGHQ
jgi:hypothetical protein